MSEKLMKIVVDLSKPKGERESYIELTAAELKRLKSDTDEYEARVELEAAQAKDKADAKASGISKLSELGLSDAEIAAIVGE